MHCSEISLGRSMKDTRPFAMPISASFSSAAGEGDFRVDAFGNVRARLLFAHDVPLKGVENISHLQKHGGYFVQAVGEHGAVAVDGLPHKLLFPECRKLLFYFFQPFGGNQREQETADHQ